MLEEFKLKDLTFDAKKNKDGTISVFDTSLVFNVDDIIERPIINDLKETYIIEEVYYDKGLGRHRPPAWKLKINNPDKASKNKQDNITVYNYKEVRGGQMIGTIDSTQNNTYSETDNSISNDLDTLLKAVHTSQLDYLVKDDLEEIINRLISFQKLKIKKLFYPELKID